MHNHQEELPTLPIGTVLQKEGYDREVIRTAPGLCLTRGLNTTTAMAYIGGAWQERGNGAAWTVKLERIEFQAEQISDCSWVLALRTVVGANDAVVIDGRGLPSHVNPHTVAVAIADLLDDMANGVQP